jgi:hypothetical protein
LILKVSGERLGNTAYKPGGVFIITFATAGISEVYNRLEYGSNIVTPDGGKGSDL